VKPAYNGTSMDWIISFAVRFILVEVLEVKDPFALKTGFLCHQVPLRGVSPYLQAIKILYPLPDIIPFYGKVC
jgi:hypothetical protein